jgi:penicillin-insensitive murein DD-endopeptidase
MSPGWSVMGLVGLLAAVAVSLAAVKDEESDAAAPEGVVRAAAKDGPSDRRETTPRPPESALRSRSRSVAASEPPSPSRSRSIGAVRSGRLAHGVRLEESEHIRLVDTDVPAGRFWGTETLVGMIQRAARRVAAQRPGNRLTVGELSPEGGGPVPGHRSHRNGRDVDLGFYLIDGDTPVYPRWFIPLGADGRGSWGRAVHFDAERNWLLVEALLSDPVAHVQLIYVAPELRRRVLRHAQRRGADAEIYARAERLLVAPIGTMSPHDNHFHVRIFCPPEDMPECRDEPPFWRWLPDTYPQPRRP